MQVTAFKNNENIRLLTEFIQSKSKILVLTGAGCSTDSGIPDYRDAKGVWKHSEPIQHQDFLNSLNSRQRYWARSMVGWRDFGKSLPNAAHLALAKLEHTGFIHTTVTQNVDRLHQQAGSTKVIDLHGRLDQVACLDCQSIQARADVQTWLTQHNPDYANRLAENAPDGDAVLEGNFSGFQIPDCNVCGGTLKPNVVFFGDNVPKTTVDQVFDNLLQADGLLIVGSSLMVFSGYRFARRSFELGLPMAAINLGVTRADDLLDIKIEASCAETLDQLLLSMDLG